jgi:hypothetical protein
LHALGPGDRGVRGDKGGGSVDPLDLGFWEVNQNKIKIQKILEIVFTTSRHQKI